MRVLVVLTCLSLLLLACSHQVRPSRLRTNYATCEATCDYYQYCRGDEDPQRYGVCISDCRSIFSEDGEFDRSSLLNLQQLECSALLTFIEGEDRRPLGSPAPGSSEI